ncbi:methyltransferase family protein [Alkalibacter saccharofermentans]|uniref:Protein-S-isoprenylcysteine O-methyltransferase Ste14 n=1 Tax=Alkalibacter saccharofermentans DSM 14828 TaxID=1120975 RepID=A0A1M4SG21_9FIRM|nr:isoprenylcysteine carboxylmethyltransferase family protein [Alkalibacter saccharofermentans]SHE31149.1 Protein-S-isoprenylcysteine O-methyltransferase Ste14 [Alkalibacter saccharofermentans DSM 14828]
MKNLKKHIISFLLPIVVCIAVPLVIIFFEISAVGDSLFNQNKAVLLLGIILLLVSCICFFIIVKFFISVSRSTIMPWNPSQRLIMTGPYAYVRNPMILSVITVLLGYSLVFASMRIFAFCFVFFIVNNLYFSLFEEPDLLKRFGKDYDHYKKNVPRWIPRAKPWNPPGNND